MKTNRGAAETSSLGVDTQDVSPVTGTGLLIVNADDWGRDEENTDRILECILCGAVSSVSAMVFMKDSERAAAIARERGVDAGLHLNFTTDFSAPSASRRLREHQQRLQNYLRTHRFAQVVYNLGLSASFQYVVAAQIDEFSRLYGTEPERLDGHHHMHLCSNVVLGKLLPSGTVVRRNFSFGPGEKGRGNRLYRTIVDWMLARRHRIVDYFFSLTPLVPPERLQRIFSLADRFKVEVETHPINPLEYRFLKEGEIFRLAGGRPVASRYGPSEAIVPSRRSGKFSDLKNRLNCSLPYAFVIGATVCQSLSEFSDCL